MKLRTRWHVVAIAMLFVPSFAILAADSLAGQVVHAITGNPLKRVTLTVTRVDGKGEPVKTQVDDNGQFVFRDLAPGGYLLSGERNAFDKQIHGSRLNPNRGTVLLVRDGQPNTGVVFRMFPKAAISGRVLDADGEPVANAGVSVFRREYHNGKREWERVDGADTNSRGEYRVHGLSTGRYLVSVARRSSSLTVSSAEMSALPETSDWVNATTYYPGTTESERAELVPIARGEDRRGVDIQLLKTTAVRIRGRIAGAAVNKMLVVNLIPRSATRPLSLTGGTAAIQPGDYVFEIRGVRPGPYILLVLASGSGSAVSASLPLDVGDRHIDGVKLDLREGGLINGRVSFDGCAKGTSVWLEAVGTVWVWPVGGRANEAGEFRFRGIYSVPFRLHVMNLPPNSYLKSVKLDGQVVNPDSVTLLPDAKIEILLGKASAELKGAVLSADGTPVAGASVVLIPESGRDELYREVISDYDGKFSIQSIAPGRYKAIAWEDIDPDAYHDPEVVKLVLDRAVPVTLTSDARGEVTLKVIPTAKQ